MCAVTPARACGASLIECLIALVVFSVGMLGVASLTVEALRNGHSALLRTQAVNLVADMQDRIRANPVAGAAYDCARYGGAPVERNCASTESSGGGRCTAAELAEDDLARWQRAARAALPLRSEPCAADVAWRAGASEGDLARYRIGLSWHEAGSEKPSSLQSDLVLVPP